MGLIDNLRKRKGEPKGKELAAFTKTSSSFIDKLKKITFISTADDKFFEELLIVLLEADVGFSTADKIVAATKIEANKYINPKLSFVIELMAEKMLKIYSEKQAASFKENHDGPNIILLVGVNGTGKTTTLAKLVYHLKNQGNKVLVAAADTFRAGATNQLLVWTKRAEVDCVTGMDNADPASVVVDACRKAKKEGYDYLICDTAGRLQNKINLMNELAKIKRVAQKELNDDVINSYLVIDATTGQNGLNQAQVFLDNCDINGIILTKLDGTSKGGIVLAIKDQLNIDVKYIGTGETLEDFLVFDIENFVLAICQSEQYEG